MPLVEHFPCRSTKGTEKGTMIRCEFKTEMAIEEEEDLVSLHGARDWRRQLTRTNDKDTEMELEVGTLIFDYHWLFAEEELWASRLVSLNKEYEEMGERRQSIEAVRMALRLSNGGEDEEG